MVDFSQRLKRLRKDKHLTQVQVAKQIGVTAACDMVNILKDRK